VEQSATAAGLNSNDSLDSGGDDSSLDSELDHVSSTSATAPYRPPRRRQRVMSIHKQPRDFTMILKKFSCCIKAYATFVTAYVHADDVPRACMPLIIEVAAENDLYSYVTCLKEDANLQEECIRFVSPSSP
jgi:hypothetical protein